jgi:hypothetical protein
VPTPTHLVPLMIATVCGLPLEIEVGTPVAALVMVKGLTEDGTFSYWHEKTDGVTLTEAYGMAMSLVDEIRAELLAGDD